MKDPFQPEGPTLASAARSAACALDAVFPDTAPDDAYLLLDRGSPVPRVTAREVRAFAEKLHRAVDGDDVA